MYVDAGRTSPRRVLPTTFPPSPGSCPSLTLTLRRRRRCPGPPYAVYSLVLLLLSGLLSPVVSQTSSVTTPSFYPFGRDAGDNATANSDDGGSGKISLLQSFPFFAKKHDKLYVSTPCKVIHFSGQILRSDLIFFFWGEGALLMINLPC